MLLSIGMIVKNEEKYLNECLNALKPILDNIDSELIIADTGSTDNTIEIARKYTSNVYNFKWNNDFAAARNSTLEHSNAEWYMYLDADEILENTDEIINFFKSESYKKFDCARYKITSFTNIDKKSFATVFLFRMFKKTNAIKFVGAIHEHIVYQPNYTTLEKTNFYHYGYMFKDSKQAKEKSNRNIELLLKEIKYGNDSPILRNQLADSYCMCHEFDEAINHCIEGVELSKHSKITSATYAIYANLVYSYFCKDLFTKAIESSKSYFDIKNKTLATDIDIYYILMCCYYHLNDFENCILYFNKYYEIFMTNKANPINTIDTISRALLFAYDKNFFEAAKIAIKSYSNLKKYDEAITLYKKNNYFVNNDTKDSLQEFFYSYIELCNISDKLINLEAIYKYIIKDNDEDINKHFETSLENYILNNKEHKEYIINIFNNLNIKSDYCKYMQLRYAYINNLSNVLELISEFINNTQTFNSNYYDVVYYIFKLNFNLNIISSKVNINELSLTYKLIQKNYDDYLEIVANYNLNTDSLLDKYILTMAYENVLIYTDKENSGKCLEVFNKYITYSREFIEYTYNPQIFEQENLFLVPQNIQFAYYCICATDKLKTNTDSEYIKLLSKALKSNENMKDIISLLLEEFKKEHTISKELSEFELLAIEVKKNINQLIQSKNYSEAILILEEYKSINPTDADIYAIEKLLN
ncbi:glycosyltransferase family 2 protein [Sedimentibacter sp. zth1]|uniref:tetratricopeptide repeat-containing glycosyltransferase family 2 protein n=1 Tax=Sedimentibacter sp. zth1 TaxID=2816908 RepID=UPI001A914FE0|nr:glycosyltransferase family 2 protein [Sedimentibacter sp. zth1]QSX07161.1 glycosyltransferase family 2 protein [Sedimentibacter sp. zth1]